MSGCRKVRTYSPWRIQACESSGSGAIKKFRVKVSDENSQRSSTSGIFKYEDVYWGIHTKPNDNRYTRSFRESKINCPRHSFAEKDMIELYPLQLQPDDDAASWIFYTNALRDIPIQSNRSTVLM